MSGPRHPPLPAKGKKLKAAAASDGDNTKEDVLRAVVLTESFQDRFQPFTVERPRCLLPLANTPLIEYTLEFLAANGVQDVFLYGGIHSAQVEAYLGASRFAATSAGSPFATLEFVPLPDASCIGDVLRDLDKRALVDSDFLVVHGDVVANLQLDGALAAHRARRQKDKDAIMTMVLREAGSAGAHRTRPTGGITPVFVLDTVSGRCLHYEEMHRLAADRRIVMDADIPLKLSTAFDVRTDLIDPGIDICTPEVLALWSETFDYQLPRRDFLNGVLRDWELTGKNIYADVVDDAAGYAARAHNLPMYEAVTRDVIGRWTFPLVPDCNLVPGQTYSLDDHSHSHVMAEEDVVVAGDAVVRSAVIGSRAVVGTGATVVNSTIGRRCRIGANVTIIDSALWDGAVVQDNSTVTRSIIGHDAVVGKNCVIPPGSLVSFNVRISDGIIFTDPTILSTRSRKNTPVPTNTQLLGPAGHGTRFIDTELAELDPEDPSSLERALFYMHPKASISTASISTFDDSSESGSDSDSGADVNDDDVDKDTTHTAAAAAAAATAAARRRVLSFMSEDGDGGGGGDIDTAAATATFHHEGVKELLEVLREDQGDLDRARLEFLSLRLAHNASEHAVRKAIATALVRRSAELMMLSSSSSSGDAARAAARVVGMRGADKFVREIGVGGAQVAFILALQTAMARAVDDDGDNDNDNDNDTVLQVSRAGVLLAALLQQLYSRDVIDEDGVFAWWADERAVRGGTTASAVREKCKVVVDWLQNAEEEDSEEEEDDDED